SHKCLVRLALKRISKATPRKISAITIKIMGIYKADNTAEYTSGKAANKPAPPNTIHVSLPSQMGATVFIITSRSPSLGKNGNKMPIPRSKPSITTYISTPKAIMPAQINDKSSMIIIPHHLVRYVGHDRPQVQGCALAHHLLPI